LCEKVYLEKFENGVDKTYLFFGIRRSGNHYIISYILHELGKSVHINDVDLSYDEYIKNSKLSVDPKKLREDNRYIPFGGSSVLISMENKMINENELRKFPKDTISMLLLRDPYNLLSSVWFTYKRNERDIVEFKSLWKSYAKLYLDENVKMVKILYDGFVTDSGYKLRVLQKLGFKNPISEDPEPIKWQTSQLKESQKAKVFGNINNVPASSEARWKNMVRDDEIDRLWGEVLLKYEREK